MEHRDGTRWDQCVQPLSSVNVRTDLPASSVPAGIVVWSTGIKAPPLVERMRGVAKDKRGFLQTNQQLQIFKESNAHQDPEPLQDVYAMGDCAQIKDHFLPATAQVGRQALRQIISLIFAKSGRESTGCLSRQSPIRKGFRSCTATV